MYEKEHDLNRTTLLTLGLLAVLLLSACTPSASAPPPTPTMMAAEPATAPVDEAPAAAPAENEAPVEAPVAIATSRGAQLVATDPSSVNLTSGEPQLIEFFAFW